MPCHYVYRTTHLASGRFYIGVRSTKWRSPRLDCYLGSGVHLKRAILVYGRDAFRKRILGVFRTRQQAMRLEGRLVTAKTLKNPRCFNLVLGGAVVAGTRFGGSNSPAHRLASSIRHRGNTYAKALRGRKQDPEFARRRIAAVRSWPGRTGMPHSKATRRKMARSSKRRTRLSSGRYGVGHAV